MQANKIKRQGVYFPSPGAAGKPLAAHRFYPALFFFWIPVDTGVIPKNPSK